MDLRLSLDLPDDLAHVSMVRKVSREVLSSYQTTREDLDDVETLVGELVTNAVRHSQASQYRIQIDLSDNCVVITVIDDGVGFARDTVPAPGTARFDGAGEERIGGWGLPLIEMLADDVQFLPNHPRGTTVRAEKRLHRAGVPAPQARQRATAEL
jgi:anti-sigma regulatory factor (Ser/Thr protein kinase)